MNNLNIATNQTVTIPASLIIPPATPAVFVRNAWMPEHLKNVLNYNPNTHLGRAIIDTKNYIVEKYGKADPFLYEMFADVIDRLASVVVLTSNLHIYVKRGSVSLENYHDRRPLEDYGWVGWKVITTAGVNFLVDAWQNSVELEVMKYHALGTGSTAEAAGDTALVTELTTEYTGNVRATGSLTEGGSANVFRSVGTNTLDGTPGAALREHGIMSADSAGTLWDRTVYAAITLSSGDSLQSTHDTTASSGG